MTAPWKSVREDERRLALAFALTYFLIIAAFTVAKIARDSLFLAELPANYLPYVYLGLALLSGLAAAALGKFHTANAQQRLSIVLGITGFSLLLFTLWFLRDPGTAAITFYLWTGIYGVVLVAEFWLLANERIDSRQARRLFGPIGAAGILGGLLTAAATSALAPFIDTIWFLVASGVLFLVAGLVTARATTMTREESTPRASVGEASKQEGKRTPETSSYTRFLVLVFLLAGVTGAVVDYAFKVVLQGELGDSGKIASALGIFYTAQGLVSIVAQVGVTGALISRFGHRLAANVLPAGVLAGGFLAAILPVAVAPWALLGTKLYELTLRFSVTKTAWEFLYFPLQGETKARVKRLIDVVVNRSADAAAGLLLVGLNFALGGSLRQLAVLIVVLATAWWVFDLRLNRAYSQEVDHALRRLVPEEERPEDLRQHVKVEELTALLESADAKRVLAAMSVLERLDSGVVVRHAPSLGRHPSAAVRARLLAIVNASGRDVEPYALLVPGIGTRPGITVHEVAGLPAAEDERVVIAAAAGRVATLDANRDPLDHLIEDTNDDVRRTALRSLALLADPSRLPRLIERLESPRDRVYARQALVLFGEGVIETLGGYAMDPTMSVSVRRQLIQTLEEIGGNEAAHALYRASRLEGDRRIVDAALKSLLALRRTASGVHLPEDEVLEDLRQEIERDGHRLVQLQALRQNAKGSLGDFLERVMRERTDQSFRRIFRRLALIHPAGPVMSAYRGVRSGRRRVRAQAIDYLDTVLPADLKARLLPLLDARDEQDRMLQATRSFASQPITLEATLQQLLDSREDWLRACGLFVVGKMRLHEHRDAALESCGATDPVVRDTAQWAVRRTE